MADFQIEIFVETALNLDRGFFVSSRGGFSDFAPEKHFFMRGIKSWYLQIKSFQLILCKANLNLQRRLVTLVFLGTY